MITVESLHFSHCSFVTSCDCACIVPVFVSPQAGVKLVSESSVCSVVPASSTLVMPGLTLYLEQANSSVLFR